jgi:hypothetical protein
MGGIQIPGCTSLGVAGNFGLLADFLFRFAFYLTTMSFFKLVHSLNLIGHLQGFPVSKLAHKT